MIKKNDIDPDLHYEHHEWIVKKKDKEQKWEEQLTRIWWTLLSTVVVGMTMSIFGILWWAIQKFVQLGGHV